MARDKTKKVLMALTKEQSDALGHQVEALIRGPKAPLGYIVNRYLSKYQTSAEETFGWTRDDLLQHMRIILWKAAATFDPSKGFKITTYMSAILYYQMGNFSKSCQTDKRTSSKMFCPEVFHQADDMVNRQETPEDWHRYSESFNVLLEDMDQNEKDILTMHLIEGNSLPEMVQKLNLPRHQVVALIKSVTAKIAEYMED